MNACQTVRGRGVLAVLMAMVLLLSGASRVWGQAQNTGTILGTVVDSSGALVVGAKVTVNETSKGVTREVTTSKSGDFFIPSLPIGNYIVTVSKEGFETYVEPSATVDADKSVKLAVKMVNGSVTDTVTVEAIGNGVETSSSTLQTTIPNTLVEDLPIDGRNVVDLAALLPGVTDLNAPATNTDDRGGPTYSVSGSRNTQNLMLFDGLMWNNLFYNTGINFPPPSALQQISVLLNNFKAQYGRNAGSVFNVLTKSGSNQIHGQVWEYFQNQMFNARDYMSGRNPEDNSNQFGFTIGGPIKKDKIYYQMTLQDLIQHLQVVSNTPVQGAAERGFLPDYQTARPCALQGVYPAGTTCASFYNDLLVSVPVTTNGVTQNQIELNKLINPMQVASTSGLSPTPDDATANFQSAYYQAGNTGTNPCMALLNQAATYAAQNPYGPGTYGSKIQSTYLPNAEVPTICINPVLGNMNPSQKSVFRTYVPLPNATCASATLVFGQPCYIGAAKQPRNDYNGTARVDWIISGAHKIDARYNTINANDATSPGVNSQSVGIPNFAISSNSAVSNFGNIGETWVVTPNIVNVLRLGYKRYVTASPPQDTNTLNTFGGNFVEPGVPTMPVISISNLFTLGSTNQALHNRVNENIEVLEQLNWTKGNHNYQFGVNYIRAQYLNTTDYPGTLAFSVSYTGLGMADAALGLLNSVQANSRLVQGGINHSVFAYAQDDWRATAKLTLNLGVRYELPFQWYQPNGFASTFVPGHQSTVFPGAIGGLAYPGDPGVLKSLVPTDFNGIVPRLGFAYDVFGNGRLAIRGGFGMFFDAINANVIGVGEPFYFQLYKTLPPGGASAPLATFGTNYSDARPNGNNYVVPTGYDKTNPQFKAPYSLFFPDRNFRTPYYEGMNFGFQMRVAKGGVLDVNYVGKLGRKQTIPVDLNPAITQCSGGYYNANPALYGNVSCKYLYGTANGNASSNSTSTQARLRYTPFNYGGGGLVDFESIGTSNYNGGQVQYTQRGGRNLTLLLSYSYSKFIDLQTASETTTNAIPDVFDISSERGVSDYDSRHVLNMGWVYTLPKVTEGPGYVRAFLNDWVFGGRLNMHSGRPFSVTINNDTALDSEPNQRAALIPGMTWKLPSNRHRAAKIQEYFNTSAFTYPTIGTFSSMQRNSLVGPAYLLTDMNLGRFFPMGWIHEGWRFQFRAEVFNVWNTPNLNNPAHSFSCSSTSIEDPTNAAFGQTCTQAGGNTSTTIGVIQSTYGNNGNTSTNGRKMQFAATLYF